jgi:hypothetical protein
MRCELDTAMGHDVGVRQDEEPRRGDAVDRFALGGDTLPPAVRIAAEAALAADGRERAVHAAIAQALVAELPVDAENVIDWRGAGAYLRTNLAGHAVRGGVFDRFVTDPGFLLVADPTLLVPALDAVASAEASAAARAYRRALAHLRGEPAYAAAALQLAARRTGAEHLADRIAYRGGLAWSTRWMLAPIVAPHLVLASLPGPVEAMWTGTGPDGTPVLAALSTTGAYAWWELPGGEPISTGSFGQPTHGGRFGGLMLPDGRHLVVGAFYEGPLTLWELADGTPAELHHVPLVGTLHVLRTSAQPGGPRFAAATVSWSRPRRPTDPSWVVNPTEQVVAWWSIEGEPPRLVAREPVPSQARLEAAGWAASGAPAAVVRGNGPVVLDLSSGARLVLRNADPVTTTGTEDTDDADASADGDARAGRDLAGVVVAAWGGSSRACYATDEGVLHRYQQPYFVNRAVVTGSGLVCGGPDGSLRLWPRERTAMRRAKPLRTPVAAACATRSDGQPVAVVAHDNGAVGVWDRADGFVQLTLLEQSAAVGVACLGAPGGPVLAVTINQRGEVRVCDVDTGETRHGFVVPPADPLPGTGSYRLPGTEGPPADQGESLRAVTATVLPDGTAIAAAVGHRGWLHRFDVVAGRYLGRTFFGRAPRAVACAVVGGRAIAVICTGNNIMGYDLETGDPVADHRVLVGRLLDQLAVVDDLVVAVDSSRHLHRWRLTGAGAGIEQVGDPFVGHDDSTWAITSGRRPDGTPIAATGTVDGVVRVWDLAAGRLLHRIPVEDVVRTLALADDLDLVVGMEQNLAVFRL